MIPPAIPDDEAERLRELRRYDVLDTLPEQVYDDLVRLAAHICGVPIALVSLVDEHRQWFKARVGLDATETPRDISFCGHVVADRAMLVVPDATADERFADNPLVAGAPDIRFYAGAPLITPNNHYVGTLCVIDQETHELSPTQRDMLQALARQVASQLEVRVSERAANAANEAKSRFLTGMSHELRTPLNAIIGYSELLQEDTEDPETHQDLGRIHTAGRHLLELINDILDLARVEAGEMRAAFASVDLPKLLDDLAGTVRPAVKARGSVLVLDLEGAPATLHTDARRLRQCLLNLLSNAAKFTEAGEVRLTVAQADGSVVFTVGDTGIGMSEEQLSRVFDPFQQADDQTSIRYGGTGLGLAITRELATLLGGRISARSAPGRGSEFVITLPATPGP